MQNRNFPWLAAALMLATAPAAASALDEINSLNADIAVLTLKAKKAELQAQIGKAKAAPDLPDLPRIPGMPPSLSSTAGAAEEAPTLKAIEGLDGDMRAVLRHANGTLEQVKVGVTTSDGWHTHQIGAGAVMQQKGKERRTLLLSSTPRVSSRAGAADPSPMTVPGVPLTPPLMPDMPR